MDEVHGMLKFGMNTFRVPFRSEYVYELWQDTWLVDNLDIPEYLPPSPYYLQMVVDLIENILAQEAPAGGGPIAVIFDMHNYMRWCPMGIGGTFSCLEPTGYNESIRYQQHSACPDSKSYPDHAAFDAACPKNASSAQLKDYWDSPTQGTDFSGAADYEMNNAAWTCPLDFGKTPPTQSRHATCSMNNNAPPKGGAKSNPYSKILTGNCFSRVWKKLLQTTVNSKAFPNTCTPLFKVLNHYSDESKNSILITPMNEPNMVETEDLALAYKDLVSIFRSEFKLRNRLLFEGNYWTGLHAQIDPNDRSAPGKHSTGCGSPGSSDQGSTKSGKMPIEVIHEALKGIKNVSRADRNKQHTTNSIQQTTHTTLALTPRTLLLPSLPAPYSCPHSPHPSLFIPAWQVDLRRPPILRLLLHGQPRVWRKLPERFMHCWHARAGQGLCQLGQIHIIRAQEPNHRRGDRVRGLPNSGTVCHTVSDLHACLQSLRVCSLCVPAVFACLQSLRVCSLCARLQSVRASPECARVSSLCVVCSLTLYSLSYIHTYYTIFYSLFRPAPTGSAPSCSSSSRRPP
jgi:hypothetical protein